MDIVKPKSCSRCKGDGADPTGRTMGACFKCGGLGVIETDRAALAARKDAVARHREAGAIVFEAARADQSIWVGWVRLEEAEPVRFAKAVDSVLAGRADVFPALAAYAA